MNLTTKLLKKVGIPVQGIGFDYLKNTGFIITSKIVEVVFSYGIILLISRYLGAEGLGLYSFLFSFVALVFILAELGLTTMMVKEISKRKTLDNRQVSNIFNIKILLTLIVFLLYGLSLFFISREGLMLALLLVGVAQIFSSFFTFSTAVLRIHNDGKSIAIATFVERILAFFLSFIVLYYTENIVLFVLVLLFSRIIKFIISLLFSLKFYKFSWGIDWSSIKPILRNSFPFLLIGLSAFIYIQIDTVMLTYMKGFVVVGWYQAAYKLINIINIIPGLFLTFGFPIFSRLLAEDKARAKSFLELIIKIMFIFVLPITAGIFFLGDRILKFIYGFDSIEAFLALKILVFAIFFIFLTSVLGNFIAAKKQVVFAKIGALGAIFNIVLNILLIPRFSLYGAAFATLATYVLMFIIMFVYVRRKMLVFSFLKNAIAPSIGVIFMLLTLHLLLSYHILIIVSACAVVYVFIQILLLLVLPTKKIL